MVYCWCLLYALKLLIDWYIVVDFFMVLKNMSKKNEILNDHFIYVDYFSIRGIFIQKSECVNYPTAKDVWGFSYLVG